MGFHIHWQVRPQKSQTRGLGMHFILLIHNIVQFDIDIVQNIGYNKIKFEVQ